MSAVFFFIIMAMGALLFLLTGCANVEPKAYAGQAPKLDIREYLNGDLKAYGVVNDYTGKMVEHFTVALKGSWNGNQGVLEEDFVYADGTTERRVWNITMHDDHRLSGTAHDVVGTMTGEQHGNALNMRYTLRRTINGREMTFSMDDWMYLVDAKHLINKTRMKKFGIPVAEITIGFVKP